MPRQLDMRTAGFTNSDADAEGDLEAMNVNGASAIQVFQVLPETLSLSRGFRLQNPHHHRHQNRRLPGNSTTHVFYHE